jgi:prephenate dehydrogenase
MKLLVVGGGEMGRWFADTVARSDDTIHICDTDETTAVEAAALLGGSVTAEAGTDTYDVVCIAVPMPAVTSVIEQYAGAASEAICDVTGSMADPVDAMRTAAPDLQRLSLHPLFAPPRAPGNVAAVSDQSGAYSELITERIADAGNTVFDTTPAEHDEAMKTVQASAHAAIFAYAEAADDVADEFHTPVSGALADLVSQVTSGEAQVYSDIQDAFDGAEDVATAAQHVAAADTEEFQELYERLK